MAFLLEAGISLAMRDAARRRGAAVLAGEKRSRRPVLARGFIPQINDFAARIDNRIVAPGSQAIELAVAGPGVTGAPLGNQKPEIRVRNHIDPRRGRQLQAPARRALPVGRGISPCRQRLRQAQARQEIDYILAAVRCKPAQPVAKEERGRGRGYGLFRSLPLTLAAALGRREPFGERGGVIGTLDLAGEGSAVAVEHDAGGGLEQDLVCLGEMGGLAHEDAARLVNQRPGIAGADQVLQLHVELFEIAGGMLVQENEIHDQPFEPPVGVGLEELAHQG